MNAAGSRHKNAIPAAVQKIIESVYDRLNDADLLQLCLKGYTQINNKSLNSVIWTYGSTSELQWRENC